MTPADDGDLVQPPGRTFFGAPPASTLEELRADVAFLGIPYDQGTIIPFIRSGAYAGPRLVREARTRLRETRPDGTSAGWFDVETEQHYLEGLRLLDCGDVLVAAGDVQATHERITAVARRVAAQGVLLVAIGGDHSISFPVGRGVASVHAPIDVVHIDAHPDFADSINGSRFQHGSQLRRLFELPSVGSVVALGLRSVDRDQYDDMRRLQVGFASTKAILEEGPQPVVERLVRPGVPTYVSIDIDVLEGGIVPATTLPEPGGLTYRQLRDLLGAIARRARVVGFDVVETSAAQPDLSTAMTSAWLVVHFLSAIFGPSNPGRRDDQPR